MYLSNLELRGNVDVLYVPKRAVYVVCSRDSNPIFCRLKAQQGGGCPHPLRDRGKASMKVAYAQKKPKVLIQYIEQAESYYYEVMVVPQRNREILIWRIQRQE